METDLTLDSEHTMQFADDVLLSCTLETCIFLLSNVTPKKSIKKKNGSEGEWVLGNLPPATLIYIS